MAVENCDDSNKSDFNRHILVSFHDGTFGISSSQSFFKPKLPPKSDIDGWVTLLKSWLDSKKAVAVRWPGDGICNSWNLFDYAEAPSCDENDKSLHSKHILKSGVIVFYSESEDEMNKERDKFILQASNNDKKYLKTKDAKKKFRYSTTRQPVAKKHSMNKKSASAEKSATNLQPALADDNLLSSPLKSLEEDCIPPSTEKKRKEKKKSTSRPFEKSATSEVILYPTAVSDNLLSFPLKLLEEDVPETIGKKHNQREKSISNGKSPTSEILVHPAAVNDNFSSSPNITMEEDEMDATIHDSSSSDSNSADSNKLTEYYEAKCYKLERIASKELQNLELCEQIEETQNSQPIVLIKEMKDAIAEIGHLIHNIHIQPTQGQHLNQQQASSSSADGTNF